MASTKRLRTREILAEKLLSLYGEKYIDQKDPRRDCKNGPEISTIIKYLPLIAEVHPVDLKPKSNSFGVWFELRREQGELKIQTTDIKPILTVNSFGSLFFSKYQYSKIEPSAHESLDLPIAPFLG